LREYAENVGLLILALRMRDVAHVYEQIGFRHGFQRRAEALNEFVREIGDETDGVAHDHGPAARHLHLTRRWIERGEEHVFRQDLGAGLASIQVSWIPAKYAIQGEVLRLKENGVWTEGWLVDSVGDAVLDAADLPDTHKERRAHRHNTGDSQPKAGR
jgi:hypothetical protein